MTIPTTKATSAYWQQTTSKRLEQQRKTIVRQSSPRIVPSWKVVRP